MGGREPHAVGDRGGCHFFPSLSRLKEVDAPSGGREHCDRGGIHFGLTPTLETPNTLRLVSVTMVSNCIRTFSPTLSLV